MKVLTLKLTKFAKNMLVLTLLLFFSCPPAAASQVYTLTVFLIGAENQGGNVMLIRLMDGHTDVSISLAENCRFIHGGLGNLPPQLRVEMSFSEFVAHHMGDMIQIDFIVERIEQEDHYFVVEARGGARLSEAE